MTYELVSADALTADQTRVLRAIYEGGYPADRRARWDDVSAGRPSSEDTFALLRDDLPVGLALTRSIADAGTVVVRYLVVDGSQRGRALGALLWRRLTELVAERGFTRLVWDVAHPDEPSDGPPECDAQLRRIGLFERVGGSLQPIGEYAKPDGRGARWVPMRLVATALDGAEVSIDERALRRLALDAYAQRYESATGDLGVASRPAWTGDDS